jgi:hypothetical protein
MPEVLEEIDITANEVSAFDPRITRAVRKKGFITSNNDSPQQINEDISYTRWSLKRANIIYSITSDPIEMDLVPELSIKKAAKIAKKFLNISPDDIVDSDLGTGF